MLIGREKLELMEAHASPLQKLARVRVRACACMSVRVHAYARARVRVSSRAQPVCAFKLARVGER